MKKFIGKLAVVMAFAILSTGCERTNETWENVKTAGRYINQSIESLFGNQDEALVASNNDEFAVPVEPDFIPLDDKDLKTQFKSAEIALPQPKYTPGEKGSGIQSIDHFQNAAAKYGNIFCNLHFNTDDHIVRAKEDMATVMRIAQFMKKNPNQHLVIEGHCDQRASAAYNMALGTRRANHARVLLVKNGVDADRIYTVSYGKEKPLIAGTTQEALKQNRRVQFKLYEKQN